MLSKRLGQNIVFILVILITLVTRYYMLNRLPALNADEAAIGYNAYSLLQTGRDEHGHPWPIHFQSFDDYKPGLYFYIVMPFVALFGLSVWSVRIPGALFGVLNVFAIWLLVKEIFPEHKIKFGRINISLYDLSAFLLAISPWHIHFSRGGWEVNAATTFVTLGVYFIVKSTRKGSTNLIYAICFLAASLYTYHAARIVVPLLVVAISLIYRNYFWSKKNFRQMVTYGLFAVVLSIPLILSIFSGDVGSRAGGVSIFADPGHVSRINELRGQHGSLTSLPARLIHNKPVVYTLEFGENYMTHFWGEYLFLSGDEIQRNKVPEMGLLYLFQLPLVLIALVDIAKRHKKWWVILFWLLIAPIPAALTFQSPHALRSQSMVIPLTIISAWGGYLLLEFLHNLKPKVISRLGYAIILLAIVWNIALYFHQYYSHMAKTFPFSSQYGVEELVSYVSQRKDEFEKIYVTDRYDQPYILFLFYLKYPPSEFQRDHMLEGRDKFGFATVKRFSNFIFGEINWDEVRNDRGTLIVGTDKEIPNEEANVVKKIYFPNSKPVFEVVELK